MKDLDKPTVGPVHLQLFRPSVIRGPCSNIPMPSVMLFNSFFSGLIKEYFWKPNIFFCFSNCPFLFCPSKIDVKVLFWASPKFLKSQCTFGPAKIDLDIIFFVSADYSQCPLEVGFDTKIIICRTCFLESEFQTEKVTYSSAFWN